MSTHSIVPGSTTITTNTHNFRSSTKEKSEKASKIPLENSSRAIFPIALTPSLVATDYAKPLVNRDISCTKAEFRLLTYYVNALMEKVLKVQFTRARTDAQGSQAKEGYQAAHASFSPRSKDRKTTEIISEIHKSGDFSPIKTEILKNVIKLSSPEKNLLKENHTDEKFVKEFITSRLPKGRADSILAGTKFYRDNNTTFENPDESNRYDSHLEKKIKLLLQTLHTLRAGKEVIIDEDDQLRIRIPVQFVESNLLKVEKKEAKIHITGEISAEDSMTWLVQWLIGHHEKAITNIKLQLSNIENLAVSFDKMYKFEQDHLDCESIEEEPFSDYLKNLQNFMTAYEFLTKKKDGCPSSDSWKKIRNDFTFLSKLQNKFSRDSLKETIAYFMTNRYHLTKIEPFDKQPFIDKYTLYLEEVDAQKTQTEIYNEPCVIANLQKMLFGIPDGHGGRNAPTRDDLIKQLSKMLAVASPLKAPVAKNASSSVVTSGKEEEKEEVSIEDKKEAVSPEKRKLENLPSSSPKKQKIKRGLFIRA